MSNKNPDTAAERGLLALMLTDFTAVPIIMRLRLRSNDFIDLKHRSIWLAAVNLWERGEPVDQLTVFEESVHADGIQPVPPTCLRELASSAVLYHTNDIPFMASSILPAEARRKRPAATIGELIDEVLRERQGGA